MCLKCHRGLSNETLLSQLKEALDASDFHMWNGTSIQHLLIAFSGVNGREVQDISEQLIVKYLEWTDKARDCGTLTFDKDINRLREIYNKLKEEPEKLYVTSDEQASSRWDAMFKTVAGNT